MKLCSVTWPKLYTWQVLHLASDATEMITAVEEREERRKRRGGRHNELALQLRNEAGDVVHLEPVLPSPPSRVFFGGHVYD